jgi:hypothetical protein
MEQLPTSILCNDRYHLGEGPTYDAAPGPELVVRHASPQEVTDGGRPPQP